MKTIKNKQVVPKKTSDSVNFARMTQSLKEARTIDWRPLEKIQNILMQNKKCV